LALSLKKGVISLKKHQKIIPTFKDQWDEELLSEELIQWERKEAEKKKEEQSQ